MEDDNADDKSVAGHVDIFATIVGDQLIRVQSSLDGNHPYLRLIGRVASEWTHFENILDEIIIELANIPEDVALCITRHLMGAGSRFKMIDSLGVLRGITPELLKKTRQLKGEQFETGEHRNRVVHDPWFAVQERRHGSGSPIETTQLKATGYQPVSEKEIIETIEKIKELIRRAAELQSEFYSQLRAS